MALISLPPCLCVLHRQPTALLRALGAVQGGQMALSVVYFQFMHRLGRPHYVWDESLYSVLEEVDIREDRYFLPQIFKCRVLPPQLYI